MCTSLVDSAHTDSIITEDKEVAELFLRQVDRYIHTWHCPLYFDIPLYVFRSTSCTCSLMKHYILRPLGFHKFPRPYVLLTHVSC